MTIPEVLLALDGDLDRPRPPEGSMPVTPEYVRWWRSLSVRERFERARDKWS